MTDLHASFPRGIAPAPVTRSSVATPVGVLAPDHEHRLRWTALRYRLPRTTAGIRSAVWRELTDLGALNLQYGVWALPHGRDHDRLDALFARIREVGGEVSASVVGRRSLEDLELQGRLTHSCERLWDAFFNDADLLVSRLAAGTTPPEDGLASLDGLRASFAAIIVRDLIGSEAAGRASARLDACAAAVLAGGDAPDVRDGRVRRRVEVVATWMLDDGDLRGAAQITPFPSVIWERAFEDFEARLYRPSARRVPVRHGTLTWTCTVDGLDASLASLDARLAHFDRYLR